MELFKCFLVFEMGVIIGVLIMCLFQINKFKD
ncbi:hypothetical protein SAMN04489758_12432 [Thomasclavelia cocleata]|uniref:DUF3789 domain-containing protein n=1 Tax=Thomasclavelia cocleata TaxID=69824 RepID=A0A1I0G1L5_9FIRM|nr:hypothetical protein IMSAGC017_01913 [Thomasclavelia cocleata]SET64569.1 hypothetical protein SAMN04489758_12432 [Thomasclavelia cocleata]